MASQTISATYGGAQIAGDLRLVTICPVCARRSRVPWSHFLGSIPRSLLQEALGVLTLACEAGHRFQASKTSMVRTN